MQPGRRDIRWQDRDAYDRAVRDHRAFQYDGRWVNPVFDPGFRAWGFWLGPIWTPLLLHGPPDQTAALLTLAGRPSAIYSR